MHSPDIHDHKTNSEVVQAPTYFLRAVDFLCKLITVERSLVLNEGTGCVDNWIVCMTFCVDNEPPFEY